MIVTVHKYIIHNNMTYTCIYQHYHVASIEVARENK